MNSPAFVYCYSSKEREVIVGRREDMNTEGWKQRGYTVVECGDTEKLYESVKRFKANEWIVTIMSDPSLFEKFLHESSDSKAGKQKNR
ncbi:hypothetical protein CHL76_11350 [Marinococcus halophilus]|uniref:Uncharacterized protein n=1 Tax=Marinococcus halophilus TaxID=1371 RepID=A0A510Y8R6_MARHA|nr:hypothetical protein [Marinococcus halophilus]OZT79725.1 hypothetical protein CHL76_11350 [Marinococcus halophilus]GEK59081.1 hypothetical protein MHA01_19860 [Marinococcus halophilus]